MPPILDSLINSNSKKEKAVIEKKNASNSSFKIFIDHAENDISQPRINIFPRKKNPMFHKPPHQLKAFYKIR